MVTVVHNGAVNVMTTRGSKTTVKCHFVAVSGLVGTQMDVECMQPENSSEDGNSSS